jgi:hypothetical protein
MKSKQKRKGWRTRRGWKYLGVTGEILINPILALYDLIPYDGFSRLLAHVQTGALEGQSTA